ncbi:acylphosphatase [Marinimicrobium alkaliphilum]|uniref:acylphosphatase n=1 Tax=Marinimicrobium alkaliphilum TaxID=2202654 RepID=UPI000DBA42A9|nr:acylphosphatase [Marinimicrobium alkaliphilum]
MQQTRRYRIAGRVQGVFYRASARSKAQELGLCGWVRNLADGQVEVLATGDAQTLSDFEEWMWQGPERARVEGLDIEVEQLQVFEGFQIV